VWRGWPIVKLLGLVIIASNCQLRISLKFDYYSMAASLYSL
jgi:hypothetical protein